MTTTIPKKLYVTVQYREDSNNESGLLGFASPYTKDAAFEKRKLTQDHWAYGYGPIVTIDKENETVTVTGKGQRGGHGCGQEWDATMLFIANCYPRIIDNAAVDGFQISNSVRRSGWGGGGNVVWRLSDPRGFELEISSENFASLLNCCTLVNGVIKEKCVWGRDGSKNVLLPESSDPYLDAMKQTTRVNSVVSLKDVQIGDIVNILSTRIEPEEQDGAEYLGRVIGLIAAGNTSGSFQQYDANARPALNFASKTIERTVFRLKNGKYLAVSTPKISAIVTTFAIPRTKADVCAELTAFVQDPNNSIDEFPCAILFAPSKIDFSKITTELVDTNIIAPAGAIPYDYQSKAVLWPGSVNWYFAPLYVCEYANNFYVGGIQQINEAGRNSLSDPILISVDMKDFAVGKIYWNANQGALANYYHRERWSTIKTSITEDMKIAVKQVKVKYNGIEGIVNYVSSY